MVYRTGSVSAAWTVVLSEAVDHVPGQDLTAYMTLLLFLIYLKKNVFWALAFVGTTIFNFYKVQYMGTFCPLLLLLLLLLLL